MSGEPLWLTEARRHLGVAEIPGAKTSPVIASWLHKLRAWWIDDETPWCGVFVAACLDSCAISLPKAWMRAKSWMDWGLPIVKPAVGCVVIFERVGGGHVGFVIGQDEQGRLLVLGGNQGNKVSIAPFMRDRVIGYRWPDAAAPSSFSAALPVLAAAGPVSTNEA